MWVPSLQRLREEWWSQYFVANEKFGERNNPNRYPQRTGTSSPQSRKAQGTVSDD